MPRPPPPINPLLPMARWAGGALIGEGALAPGESQPIGKRRGAGVTGGRPFL